MTVRSGTEPSRRLRYLAVADSIFPDLPGGFQRVAWDITMALRDRGHRVAMFAFANGAGKDRPPVSVHDGIDVFRCTQPMLPRWHPNRMRRTIDAAAAAARALLDNEPWDVVHVHSHLSGAGVLKAMDPGQRHVFTLHSPLVAENRINWTHQGLTGQLKLLFGMPLLHRLEARLLAGATRIHTLSEYTRAQVEREHGLGDRVQVVPHWRRQDLRREHDRAAARRRLAWPADEKILFSVRRLGPRYGIDVAIDAVAPLAREGRCIFYVAGDGELRGRLEKTIRQGGVGDRVRLLGHLSDEMLNLAYEAADLFVLPTLALECFGLIILEAFSFGCPVISTNVGAIPEAMGPILPDFLVPAGDTVALRTRVADFLEGRLAPPSPETIVRYVEDRYGRDVVLPRVVSLIEGAAS